MKSLFKYFCLCIAMAAIPMASVAVDYELEAKSAVKKNSCPMKNDEELVCAVIMCDFGALMGEYPSECHKVKLDFAVYLATLGFWDKPPKCFQRDKNCNKTGKARKQPITESFCKDTVTGESDPNCLRGLNIFNMDCSEELLEEKKAACYAELSLKNDMCEKIVNGVSQSVPCDESVSRGITLHEVKYHSLQEKYAGDPTVKVVPQGIFHMGMVPPGSVYYWTRDTTGELVMLIFLRSQKTEHCLSMAPDKMLTCLGGEERMWANDWPQECKNTRDFKTCMEKYGLL